MGLVKKLARLKKIILGYKSVLVAFSGGQDSAFLLKSCLDTLGAAKVLAVTAVSPTYPAGELDAARKLAAQVGSPFKVIRTNELGNKKFAQNPLERCYYCKQELFLKLKSLAREHKLEQVAEASSLTDQKDYRPGRLAKEQLKIKSPLEEAGLTKQDIRKASKKMGLSSWDKPSLACLASRIPYGTRINPVLLRRIDTAENYLRGLGLRQVRLRHYGDLCRIEVEKKYLGIVLRQRKAICAKLKKSGYNYITLDLEGYRTGSLNEVMFK